MSLFVWSVAGLFIRPSFAAPFFFSTGDPDGKMGTGSRPQSGSEIQIESADDFILSSPTQIDSATFTGLLTPGVPSGIPEVRVKIYRVFPKDSATPPSGNVPTRTNSPSDFNIDDRDSAAGTLSFTPTVLNPSFTVANTVLNGIHPIPNQTTGGEGPATGVEVQFNVAFTTLLTLPADHYFFVPQVQLASGDFLWLSAPRPIVAPGTPFSGDLQEWIRNTNLEPDWLRVGTDIVDGGSSAPTFNAAFSLTGETVPEPSTMVLMLSGFSLIARRRSLARQRSR